ncbi:MAG: homoserine kinase [Chloroflexi bacterium]|nr:homoserine kinase [Chloroflexota bacterium]
MPATSANLGPGFDCLGLALDLRLRVTCSPRLEGLHIVSGDPAISAGEDNLIWQAMSRVFEFAGAASPGVELRIENGIPLSRGLGSSSAAIIAGLTLANELMGGGYSQQELLGVGLPLEGHPDNLAPALFGGLTVAVLAGENPIVARVPLPRPPGVALFVPDQPMATAEARRLLPESVPRADAVFNTGRSALLVAGLATGDFSVLRRATEDRLHQPYRAAMFEAMPELIQAALDAGAAGAALSGAGSTIIALCEGDPRPPSEAMAAAAARLEVAGAARTASIDLAGARLVS